jgi:phospholipase C
MIKLLVASLLITCSAAIGAQGQIPNFKHIIVVVQENRTPDNLFQGLCSAPFGSLTGCSTTPGAGQYNIQTSDWLDKTSSTGVTQPRKVTLANTYDLDHSHTGFNAMCDMVGGTCKMDGAAGISCNPQTGTTCPGSPQFKFVINKKGILNPYLQLATQYGWSNYMFQTNQGPSFPAHQFLFGATSAPTTQDDGLGIYASENMLKTGGTGGTNVVAGCTALAKTQVKVIMPDGTENTTTFPCFEHQTLGDMLDAAPGPGPAVGISWRYYAPSLGSIWTAPNAIRHICEPSGPNGDCMGQVFMDHVDIPTKIQPPPPGAPMGSVDILTDISSCSLRQVSWVIPSCQNSDHASCNDGGGPSWVASIVNAVGKATSCDGGTGYWNDTAIVITWDDWGGWYDHEAPTILPPPFGGYQYGFRVPMIFVSAYTPPAYINNNRHDFGSIVKFIQRNFGLTEGGLMFADQRSKTNLAEFYDLTQPPRTFQTVTASRPASFFLKDKRKMLDPDDQ